MEEKIRLPEVSGFVVLKSKIPGTSLISFIQKPADVEYEIGEQTKISGVCSYQFLSSSGLVRGVLFSSPKANTVLEPTSLKIGPMDGQFAMNQNLLQIGILIYQSQSGGVLIIPTSVSSPLLVEVDT